MARTHSLPTTPSRSKRALTELGWKAAHPRTPFGRRRMRASLRRTSLADDPVGITIRIDGDVGVDDDFPSGVSTTGSRSNSMLHLVTTS